MTTDCDLTAEEVAKRLDVAGLPSADAAARHVPHGVLACCQSHAVLGAHAAPKHTALSGLTGCVPEAFVDGNQCNELLISASVIGMVLLCQDTKALGNLRDPCRWG